MCFWSFSIRTPCPRALQYQFGGVNFGGAGGEDGYTLPDHQALELHGIL